MIRVGFWTPSAEIGGAENSLLLLLKGLDRNLFDPIVICSSSGPMENQVARMGVCYKVVQPGPRFLRLSREGTFNPLALIDGIKLLKDLAKLLIKEKIDVLYTNGIKFHILGCLLSLICRVQLVWHFRDVLSKGKLKFAIQLLGQLFPRKIIAASQATAKQFSGPADTSEKIEVVYNGVDLRAFQPGSSTISAIDDLDLSGFDHIVGAFGMLVPLKGYEYFVEAAETVLRTFPKTLFLIVGGEIYLTAKKGHQNHGQLLKHIVQKKNLDDAILLTGYRNNVSQLIQCCDVVVLPSIHPESCPRTVLEAMACGKPVVGTDLGGTCELIDDGHTGKLVKHRDTTALAEGISHFLSDNSAREMAGRQARAQAERLFSSKPHCLRIQSILLSMNEINC